MKTAKMKFFICFTTLAFLLFACIGTRKKSNTNFHILCPTNTLNVKSVIFFNEKKIGEVCSLKNLSDSIDCVQVCLDNMEIMLNKKSNFRLIKFGMLGEYILWIENDSSSTTALSYLSINDTITLHSENKTIPSDMKSHFSDTTYIINTVDSISNKIKKILDKIPTSQ